MRIVSHPEADQELAAAALWYEDRQRGLGDDYFNEFEHTLRRELADPHRRREVRGENRKLNFRRFPLPLFTVRGAPPTILLAIP